jgi:hypothetical protein
MHKRSSFKGQDDDMCHDSEPPVEVVTLYALHGPVFWMHRSIFSKDRALMLIPQ